MLHEHRFRTMNTDVGAWLWSSRPGAAVHLAEVERTFADTEAALSRFRPDSELSRLNLKAGAGPQPVSAMLWAVLAEALAAAHDSGGIFDPTLLHPLCRAGYDRSFEQLPARVRGASPLTPDPNAGLDWRRVVLDAEQGAVGLPAGMGLDLGGIAKGWAVDQAVANLARWGPALVDAGGDMRAVGRPEGEPWPVAVQDPFRPEADLLTICLADTAVATSSVGGRRWVRDGQPMHHLMDPRTGRPGRSDVHTATVIAPTAVQADVAAKVALILGVDDGSRYLLERELSGLLVDRSGGQHPAGQFEEYLP